MCAYAHTCVRAPTGSGRSLTGWGSEAGEEPREARSWVRGGSPLIQDRGWGGEASFLSVPRATGWLVLKKGLCHSDFIFGICKEPGRRLPEGCPGLPTVASASGLWNESPLWNPVCSGPIRLQGAPLCPPLSFLRSPHSWHSPGTGQGSLEDLLRFEMPEGLPSEAPPLTSVCPVAQVCLGKKARLSFPQPTKTSSGLWAQHRHLSLVPSP